MKQRIAELTAQMSAQVTAQVAAKASARLMSVVPKSTGVSTAVDGTQMMVPINGTTYRVVVTPGPLLVRGETSASRVRHRDRVIEVDAIIPASDRWRVAALAVAYACRKRQRSQFHPVRVVGTVD